MNVPKVVEAMGLEPTNLLTARRVKFVRSSCALLGLGRSSWPSGSGGFGLQWSVWSRLCGVWLTNPLTKSRIGVLLVSA
jgi:hypothetical protein